MKKCASIILSALFVILAISGCNKSSCGACYNGGDCDGTVCACKGNYGGLRCDTLCPLGYEGQDCSQLSRDRFIGTWKCTVSTSSGNQDFILTLSEFPTIGSYMYMTNFNNKRYTVFCDMLGKTTFNVTGQISTGPVRANVSGDGQLSGSTLRLNIQEDGVSYYATGTKQ